MSSARSRIQALRTCYLMLPINVADSSNTTNVLWQVHAQCLVEENIKVLQSFFSRRQSFALIKHQRCNSKHHSSTLQGNECLLTFPQTMNAL